MSNAMELEERIAELLAENDGLHQENGCLVSENYQLKCELLQLYRLLHKGALS